MSKYNFDHVPVDPNRVGRKPISEGIPPGRIRTQISPFKRRKCPDCEKMNYDFTQCVYCGKDITNEPCV